MRIPSERELQGAAVIVWPSDFHYVKNPDAVKKAFARIIAEVSLREGVIIVTAEDDPEAGEFLSLSKSLSLEVCQDRIKTVPCRTDSLRLRSYGPVPVYGDKDEKYLYDFSYNGRGLRTPAFNDNQLNKKIFFGGAFPSDVMCVDMRPFIFGGDEVLSDGNGTGIVSLPNAVSVNMNDYLDAAEAEGEIRHAFGLRKVLSLECGHVSGLDGYTEVSEVLRLGGDNVLLYASTELSDGEDLEKEISSLRSASGKKYSLSGVPLEYMGFLVVNNAVIVPSFGEPEKDAKAAETIHRAFPRRKVVGVDCRSLYSSGLSPYGVTVTLPAGYFSE